MKNAFLIVLVLFCLGCEQKEKENKEESQAVSIEKNFDWLIGNWERINEKEGKQTYENWVKLNDGAYRGIGFTIKDNDTVWQESIWLNKASETWNFEVKGKSDPMPTVFMVTAIEEGSFICENEENEFPKKIRYSKGENGIVAAISGGDMEILFEFEPFSMN
jgi:hypothetical protein